MFDKIPVPAKGQPARASWGAAISHRVNEICAMVPPNGLARDGVTGTGFAPLPQNRRDRRAASELHPWKVFAVGKSEDVDHFFEIYIPDGSIVAGAKEIEVEGIEETETPKRFTFACETDVGESSTLYLVVYRDEEEDAGASGAEEDEKCYKSVLSVNLEDYEGDESVTDVIPIASLTVKSGERYDTGRVVSQMQKQEIRLDDRNVPVDKVSIDKVTAEDAKDPDAIQVKDFDNDKSDGGQGLAQRLRVVKDGKESYHLEADGDGVFLIARVNGKIKYIPLSGKDEKDPDEDLPTSPEECDHPGDTPGTGIGGGVPAEGEEEHGVPADAGGVPAGGDTHAGEPCPDCSPTR